MKDDRVVKYVIIFIKLRKIVKYMNVKSSYFYIWKFDYDEHLFDE